MEPRRDRRGFLLAILDALERAKKLQWSLGVIAEDSGKPSPRPSSWPGWLQWSLGVFAEDSAPVRLVVGHGLADRASMEPRRDRRGFGMWTKPDPSPIAGASMEPRRDRRGFPRRCREGSA